MVVTESQKRAKQKYRMKTSRIEIEFGVEEQDLNEDFCAYCKSKGLAKSTVIKSLLSNLLYR